MRRGVVVVAMCLLLALPCAAEEIVSAAGAPVILSDPSQLDIAYIEGGALVTNLLHANDRGVIARYTGVDLGEVPRKVECRARFLGGGAVAIVITPNDGWSLAVITDRSIHAVFTAASYHFGFYEGGVLTDVLAGEYTLDVTGEKEYAFGLTIARDKITLQLPNGKTAVKIDERAKTCAGPYVIFEHYLSAEDVAAKAMPVITQVYAKGAELPALTDDFQRADGLPIAAPSGHAYQQFGNEHVAEVAPAVEITPAPTQDADETYFFSGRGDA